MENSYEQVSRWLGNMAPDFTVNHKTNKFETKAFTSIHQNARDTQPYTAQLQGHTKITSKLPVVTVVKQVHKIAELCSPPQSRLRKILEMITSVLWQKFLYSGLSLFFFLLL